MSTLADDSLADTMTRALREERSLLFEHEVYALLEEADIRTPGHVFVPAGEAVTNDTLAPITSKQVVLKIVSAEITHKSDAGGITVSSRDAKAVNEAMTHMLSEVAHRCPSATLRGVLVVERVDYQADMPGLEFLLSIRRDPAFGAVIFFGIGGLLTEWYGKLSARNSRVLLPAEPLEVATALQVINRTEIGRLALEASRLHKRPPIEWSALGSALEGLAKLFQQSTSDEMVLTELEINPLAVVDGQLMALDGLAQIGRPEVTTRRPRPLHRVAQLLHPKSAAVFGASTKSRNAGRIILQNLKQSAGLDYGRLYAVHPDAEMIDGVRCYKNAKALPESVDLAVISVPARVAGDVVEELTESGKAASLILIPGGFAETGHAERAEQIQAALARSRDREDRGPVLVGGNCLGIVSKNEYNTFFLPHYKLPLNDAPGDNLAAVGQSGAYLVSFTSNLDGIIFPRASISYGNEMDLTAADFLEYYLDHEPEAKTFAFYIEGFGPGEGRRFARLARRATDSGRPVIVYKAGRTAEGAQAAASHTASMAGDFEVARCVLESAGALVTNTLNMFEDYTKIFTMLGNERPIHDRRVGIITNAGFEAGAVSDRLYTLRLAEFHQGTCDLLAQSLPGIATVRNPVDTTPMAGTSIFATAVEEIAEDEGVDMLIVSAIPAAPGLDVLAPDLGGSHEENIFGLGSLPAELVRIHQATKKPMVVAIDSGRLYDPTTLFMQRYGIPVYRKIDRASRALSAYASFHLRGRDGA